MTRHRAIASLPALILLLSGCSTLHNNWDALWAKKDTASHVAAPAAGASHANSPLAQKQYDTIATGKVVAISDKEIIVDTAKDILFVDITANDKTRLHDLSKGTQITLRGHTYPGKGGKPAETDVEDILLSNGSDIPLE